jgi:hypothetical protein
MAGRVMRVQEYRSKCAACLLAAEHSRLPEVRVQWLAMAQAWLKLADDVEKRMSPAPGDESPHSN